LENKLSDLYNHLFRTLETLKETKPAFLDPEIKRATAIEAAKLEVAVRKLTKNIPQSGFFEAPELPEAEKLNLLKAGEEE